MCENSGKIFGETVSHSSQHKKFPNCLRLKRLSTLFIQHILIKSLKLKILKKSTQNTFKRASFLSFFAIEFWNFLKFFKNSHFSTKNCFNFSTIFLEISKEFPRIFVDIFLCLELRNAKRSKNF